MLKNLNPSLWHYRIFSLWVPAVLGHTASKNEGVDQTERWVAEQGLLSESKVIIQSSREGRGPERVAVGIPKSRGFYGPVGRLF